jgi:enoyl-CoA hydratase/carnithine racemase
MIGRSLDEERDIFAVCNKLMSTVQSIPVPVIAAPHGIATAAGCQLVATCDLAVARNVGRKNAMEMLLTGRFVDAATAEKWGLINRAVPLAQLDGQVMALVKELAQFSPYALRIGKEGFYRQVEERQAEAYRQMAEAISCNAAAPDGQEGILAFVNKRAPVWKGDA